MNRSTQAAMAIKTIVVLLVGLALASSVHLADAQQPVKMPRIGYLAPGGSLPRACPARCIPPGSA